MRTATVAIVFLAVFSVADAIDDDSFMDLLMKKLLRAGTESLEGQADERQNETYPLYVIGYDTAPEEDDSVLSTLRAAKGLSNMKEKLKLSSRKPFGFGYTEGSGSYDRLWDDGLFAKDKRRF